MNLIIIPDNTYPKITPDNRYPIIIPDNAYPKSENKLQHNNSLYACISPKIAFQYGSLHLLLLCYEFIA